MIFPHVLPGTSTITTTHAGFHNDIAAVLEARYAQRVVNVLDAVRLGALGVSPLVPDDPDTDNLPLMMDIRDALVAEGGKWTLVLPPGDYWWASREDGQAVYLNAPGISLQGLPGCRFRSSGLTNIQPWILNESTTELAATLAGDVAQGDVTFEVDDSSGLTVGDLVYFRFGDIPYDLPESLDFGFAYVTAIPDSTHVTLSTPCTEAIDVSETVNNKHIYRVTNLVENQFVSGIHFEPDDEGTTRVQGVGWKYARSCWMDDVTGRYVTQGVVWYQYCDTLHFRRCGNLDSEVKDSAPTTTGRIFGYGSESRNVTFEVFRGENFYGRVQSSEARSRNVLFRGGYLHLPPGRQADEGIFATGGNQQLAVEDVVLVGDGTNQILVRAGNQGRGNTSIRNLVSLCVPQIDSIYAHQLRGRFEWLHPADGVRYWYDMDAPIWHTKTVTLSNGMNNVNFDTDDDGITMLGLLIETLALVPAGIDSNELTKLNAWRVAQPAGVDTIPWTAGATRQAYYQIGAGHDSASLHTSGIRLRISTGATGAAGAVVVVRFKVVRGYTMDA